MNKSYQRGLIISACFGGFAANHPLMSLLHCFNYSIFRPSQDNRDYTGPRTRQNQEQKLTTRHSCDFSPSKSKLPLPRQYLHQPVPRPKEELSKSKAPGLGKRAATELEFSRPCVSGQLSHDQRVPPGGSIDHPLVEHGDNLVRKGLMWVQQDKLFSRWKERFIILTTGYLQIFKKGTSRISDMGTFVSKVCKTNLYMMNCSLTFCRFAFLMSTQSHWKIGGVT